MLSWYACAHDGCEMLLDRITSDAEIMCGKACVRGTRVTVGTIVGLVTSDHSMPEILTGYPYLEEEDMRQALAYEKRREDRMIRACEIANADPDTLRIEQEWDGLHDEVDQIEETYEVPDGSAADRRADLP